MCKGGCVWQRTGMAHGNHACALTKVVKHDQDEEENEGEEPKLASLLDEANAEQMEDEGWSSGSHCGLVVFNSAQEGANISHQCGIGF